MNLDGPGSLSTGVLDSSTMTVLESMVPSDVQPSQPMVIYVQSNPQVGGQMLSLSEDIPLTFPGVDSLENLGGSGEQIVTLVDDLGQALGEGQAVPVTLSDVGNIDFVDGAGAAFQTEDGQVLYLTYTVDHSSGEGNLQDGVSLQTQSEVDMLTELSIPPAQQPQPILLHMSGGATSYLTAGVGNEEFITPESSMSLISIPDNKKTASGKKETAQSRRRTAVDHRKTTTRVIGPDVHIEDKLQVLEAMVPRIERPKKKKNEPKLVKEKVKIELEEICSVKKEDAEKEKKGVEDEENNDEPKKEERIEDGMKEDGLYMCDLCGNAYPRAAQYYGHLHTHSGERDWNCHLCGEVFKSHSQLRRHESRSHLNMRPYPCSICGNRFDRASQLRYHERRIHAGEKPHLCLICSKGFFKRSDLRTHLNIHLGINKSICETCGQQFNHVSNLIRHIRVHTGIKPYPCNVCGRRFSQVNALQHHKDSHNMSREFNCTYCHKQFKSNLLLKKHIRSIHADVAGTNTDEASKFLGQNRRYYCNVCGEDFPFSAMLKDHESKHQKETNFHCNCCGNDYTSADEFKVHSCMERECVKSVKRDDSSPKKDVVNSYSELLRRITKEVTDEIKDEVNAQEVSEQEGALPVDTRESVEMEPSLTKAQALILGKGGEAKIDTGKGGSNISKEQGEVMKMNEMVEEVKGGNTLKVIQSGDMETSWIVNSSCVPEESSKEEKWIPMIPQEESEIVIYVTPDVNNKVDLKEMSLQNDNNFFKKEEMCAEGELLHNPEDLEGSHEIGKDPGSLNLQPDQNCAIADPVNLDPLVSSNDVRKEECHNVSTQGERNAEKEQATEMEVTNEGNKIHADTPKEKIKGQAKTFKCKECGKVFSKNSNYKQHLGIHFVDLQRYQCTLCGQSFAWKSTLNKHMTNSHHTGPAPKFSCGYCTKEYTTSSQVQEHIKRDHFKERPHTCTECEKTFYKKYDLKIHLRTHTKEKPYICGACGKAFYHLSHIIRHERIHTGERPYKCDDCGREFNQSSTLKTHKIRHSISSASANKLENNTKLVINGESVTVTAALHDGPRKARAAKKAAGTCLVEPEINIGILSAKDENLGFENIPTSYEGILT